MSNYIYKYSLPKELIRNEPLEKRDESRLFVFDTKTGEIKHDVFKNISKYITDKSLFVLNNTKVVKSRIFLHKESGGKVEVFILANEIKDFSKLEVLVDRKVNIGEYLYTVDKMYKFKIIEQKENKFVLENLNENPKSHLENLMNKYGEVPLPKYIHSENKNIHEERYNTVFKKEGLSVAAPTASLHFTKDVFESLKEKSCDFSEVRLDVGFGTFTLPSEENIKKGKLHTEPVFIKKNEYTKIESARSENRSIVCVGTTALRSIESLSVKKINILNDEICFDTDIFITPGFNFKYVDILVTNFHLPETSLMMLVQAFIQFKGSDEKLVDLYEKAIQEKYCFYSYGDSMLII